MYIREKRLLRLKRRHERFSRQENTYFFQGFCSCGLWQAVIASFSGQVLTEINKAIVVVFCLLFAQDRMLLLVIANAVNWVL